MNLYSARRRIHAHRVDRSRTVFTSPPAHPTCELLEPLAMSDSLIRAGLAKLRGRGSGSAVGGVLLRPVRDAVTTVQSFRSP